MFYSMAEKYVSKMAGETHSDFRGMHAVSVHIV